MRLVPADATQKPASNLSPAPLLAGGRRATQVLNGSAGARCSKSSFLSAFCSTLVLQADIFVSLLSSCHVCICLSLFVHVCLIFNG